MMKVIYLLTRKEAKTREKMLAEGYRYYCIACHRVFKQPPTEQYEDGHGGRPLEMCKCGCDMFANLKDGTRRE